MCEDEGIVPKNDYLKMFAWWMLYWCCMVFLFLFVTLYMTGHEGDYLSVHILLQFLRSVIKIRYRCKTKETVLFFDVISSLFLLSFPCFSLAFLCSFCYNFFCFWWLE
jgi:hypothetical protein